MADIRSAYGSKSTLTTTNFTSLANSSGWQSAAIDVDTTKFVDLLVRIQTKGQASGTSVVEFYLAPSVNADSVFADGATGTEGTFTAGNRFNAVFLDAVTINAATAAVQKVLRSVVSVLGFLPQKFVLIAINKSGAAMSATGADHVIDVQPVYLTVA